jgi:hypothetical protein
MRPVGKPHRDAIQKLNADRHSPSNSRSDSALAQTPRLRPRYWIFEAKKRLQHAEKGLIHKGRNL